MWKGKEEGKPGVAIIPSQATTLVEVAETHNLPDNVIVILAEVKGSMSFLLLAAWAKKTTQTDEYTGVRGLHRAIDACERLMTSKPTVMMGSFVSNTEWDDEHPPDRNHTALVKRLDKLGLASAYHTFFSEEQGKETRPTYWHSKKKDEKWPSHIDYCFVPKTWAVSAVTVGSFEEWRTKSAHMPVVVEVHERELSTIP